MKRKVLFAALAVMVALGATAQNKAIELMAEKYIDRDGFMVVNLEGEMIAGLAAMMNSNEGNGTITFDDGNEISTTDLLEGIESVVAVVSRKTDEQFVKEAELALESGKYSPIMSTVAQNGSNMKVVCTDIERGKYKGNVEIVALVNDNSGVVLARVIGKIDTRLLGTIINKAMD